MKLITSLTLGVLTTSSLFASTTMCFKENHSSMATIETTTLDGGLCSSSKSIKDMKNEGWNVDDIKITTTNDGKYNFIYILKKGDINSKLTAVNSNLSQEELENKILKRLEKKQEEEKKEKEIEKILQSKIKGKEFYTNKCQSCHGEKGEKAAYNASRPLKDMSIDDMEYSINRYTNDSQYGNGYQTLMGPIAAGVKKDNIEKIYNYLKSINK